MTLADLIVYIESGQTHNWSWWIDKVEQGPWDDWSETPEWRERGT